MAFKMAFISCLVLGLLFTIVVAKKSHPEEHVVASYSKQNETRNLWRDEVQPELLLKETVHITFKSGLGE